MKVIIKNPNERPKYSYINNNYFTFYEIIGAPFVVLPIGNVNLFFNANVTDGAPNITVNNIQICGPIIITGSTPDGIETSLNKNHLTTLRCLIY